MSEDRLDALERRVRALERAVFLSATAQETIDLLLCPVCGVFAVRGPAACFRANCCGVSPSYSVAAGPAAP